MIPTRCQICGRRKGKRADGSIRFHHVAGVPCLGAGFPPIEEDDARLAEAVEIARAAERAASRELSALYDRQANYIPPELIERLRRAARQENRLASRLKRHRNWPARFARQMERDGWGDRPPAYLLTRHA